LFSLLLPLSFIFSGDKHLDKKKLFYFQIVLKANESLPKASEKEIPASTIATKAAPLAQNVAQNTLI